MVDAGGEVDFGWLEWVVGGKVDGEEEDTARVWTIALFSESDFDREIIGTAQGRGRAWGGASTKRETQVYVRVPLSSLASGTRVTGMLADAEEVRSKCWPADFQVLLLGKDIPSRLRWDRQNMMKGDRYSRTISLERCTEIT